MDRDSKNLQAKYKKSIRRCALIFFFLMSFFSACIFYYRDRYCRLLEKDPNALIITNDAVTAKQISAYREQDDSAYSLEDMKAEITQVFSLDYSHQFTGILEKAEIDQGRESDASSDNIHYRITFPQYESEDTFTAGNINPAILSYGSLYLNHVHGQIKPIGEEWGSYYCNLLMKNQYHTFAILSQGQTELYRQGQGLYDPEVYTFLTVALYKVNQSEAGQYQVLLLEQQDYEALGLPDRVLQDFSQIPIVDLERILSKCVNYPDRSVETVKQVRDVVPSRSDCLYFSIVTITTTGYGDILPNSSQARRIVQSEILVGVVIMGLLLSALWKLIGSINRARCRDDWI